VFFAAVGSMSDRAAPLVFATTTIVLGIGCLVWLNRVVIRQHSATQAVAEAGVARADQLRAKQAQARLDGIFTRIEQGEPVPAGELDKAIAAVASDAGDIQDLYARVATLSHGAPYAKLHTQAGVALARQEGAPAAPTAQRKPPPAPIVHSPPPSDPYAGFWNSSFTLSTQSRELNQWNRFSTHEPQIFALNIEGTLRLGMEMTNQRNIVSAKGVPGALLHDPRVVPFMRDPDPAHLVAPHSPFFAVLARSCDIDACEKPTAFPGNPWVICLPADQWLELRINAFIRSDPWDFSGFHSFQGEFTITPQRIDPASCQG
jgi:hypothetical protein